MSDDRLRMVAAALLVLGALLGMAGTFAPTSDLRSIAWGIDGTALIVATAILAIHHLRQGRDQLAAGFLVFMVGETLIVAGSAMTLEASTPLFAAGAALWSASLALTSGAQIFHVVIRATGAIASILFAITALQIFGGQPLTPLTMPLPYYAYPFLAITLIGWAWTHAPRQRTGLR